MSKFWKNYFLISSLFIALLSLIFWIVFPALVPVSKINASPLPEFLTLIDNSQVSTLDLWEPIRKFFADGTVLNITATSALSYDLTSNKQLFEKNPQKKLPFASLTKIMTAVLALENFSPDEMLSVPQSAIVGEDSMGLDAGEKLSVKELLYGLFLHSGNDAAETIAANFKGGRSAFVNAMNEKADSLGLKNTHFTNPTGLQGDGDQYTTAYDLLVLTRYAIENFSRFTEISSTISIDLPQTQTHKEFYLENETNLLTSYPGVKGVKTGFTPEAGLCLVTYLDYKGHKIIAVLLGSENRRDEMKQILDYSLNKLGVKPPPHV